MHFYLGVTDNQWFTALQHATARRVRFLDPSGRSFGVSQPGQRIPLQAQSARTTHIGGGGAFVRSEQLPLRLAWEVFGSVANGCATFAEFAHKIIGYRQNRPQIATAIRRLRVWCWRGRVFSSHAGAGSPCLPDWAGNIATGKTHDTADPIHAALWQRYVALRDAYRAYHPDTAVRTMAATPARYGHEYMVAPRVGQSAYRLQVLATYGRRCAITREHTPLVLEAAHIRPYAQEGAHALANALLLRADFHRLFDAGYVTVDPAYRIQGQPAHCSRDSQWRALSTARRRRIHLPAIVRCRQTAICWHGTRIRCFWRGEKGEYFFAESCAPESCDSLGREGIVCGALRPRFADVIYHFESIKDINKWNECIKAQCHAYAHAQPCCTHFCG
jgi:putative restriction endonuclease